MALLDRFALKPGVLYLTEGGTETEIMYRHGHELREFAMFELIDKPDAVADLRDMYRRYLDVAERYSFGALIAGLDYRASPDWARKIGYSDSALFDMQRRCVSFLQEIAAPYRDRLPDVRICGCVGPRGDAYALNQSISADEAEAYHRVQLQTLKSCGADLAWAATFNNVPEAVGACRAAFDVGLPITVSFVLDRNHRLKSGPSLRQAIDQTDSDAGPARPAFYGLNCSHPDEFAPALEPGDWILRLQSLRPNATRMDKVSLCRLGHIEEGDPDELGRQMGALAKRFPHMNVWGGCCGTWDAHFEEIARNVRAVHPTSDPR